MNTQKTIRIRQINVLDQTRSPSMPPLQFRSLILCLYMYEPPRDDVKGRVWSKIIFCVRLAFAVKIVAAMTAQLNLAWFTRYEPRKLDGDDVTAVSLTRARAMRYISVSLGDVFRGA